MLLDMQMPVRNVCVHMPRRNVSAERNRFLSLKINEILCLPIPVAAPRGQPPEDALKALARHSRECIQFIAS